VRGIQYVECKIFGAEDTAIKTLYRREQRKQRTDLATDCSDDADTAQNGGIRRSGILQQETEGTEKNGTG
jgi:hypothetical protein